MDKDLEQPLPFFVPCKNCRKPLDYASGDYCSFECRDDADEAERERVFGIRLMEAIKLFGAAAVGATITAIALWRLM